MSELMTVKDAEARLGEIRDGEDKVEFLHSMAEVKLEGVFNVEDLEALYVLMVYGPLERKRTA